MLVDFQVRMRLVMGWRGHGVQHPYGPREALPVLCARVARAGDRDGRDHRAADFNLSKSPLVLAPPGAGGAGDVPGRRGACRIGPRVVGRVLEPLALADLPRLPAYWNFLWDSNPQTYYSSRSSSGSPSKSSMAAEAAAEAVSRFAQPRKPYSPDRGERYPILETHHADADSGQSGALCLKPS
jgi:hypothetical protein